MPKKDANSSWHITGLRSYKHLVKRFSIDQLFSPQNPMIHIRQPNRFLATVYMLCAVFRANHAEIVAIIPVYKRSKLCVVFVNVLRRPSHCWAIMNQLIEG